MTVCDRCDKKSYERNKDIVGFRVETSFGHGAPMTWWLDLCEDCEEIVRTKLAEVMQRGPQ